ncbi:hypothetical protein [Lentzea sp.]|uniref:hypothetical protein n=1 Tax=Lentzea sp. TaxID=56099 RepID=UPI002ED16861
MRRINDGYNNVAHLHDLDPRYDRENDDVRDRVEFGEAPQREWIPRGTRARKTAATPKRRWHAAARAWVERNPQAGYKACAAAMVRMGYVGVTKATVSELMRQKPEPAKKKAKPKAVRRPVPQYRPYVPAPRPPEPPRLKVRYCDGCGLAVSESGACRC